MINVLEKAGRIEEVNKLFQQMKDSGINPDVVIYNTLIEVQAKVGQLKQAYKFIKLTASSTNATAYHQHKKDCEQNLSLLSYLNESI